jgi:hypothetical protein
MTSVPRTDATSDDWPRCCSLFVMVAASAASSPAPTGCTGLKTATVAPVVVVVHADITVIDAKRNRGRAALRRVGTTEVCTKRTADRDG